MAAVLEMRRSPYGERGLKFLDTCSNEHTIRRSPYGERGLKSQAEGREGHKEGVALLTESVD